MHQSVTMHLICNHQTHVDMFHHSNLLEKPTISIYICFYCCSAIQLDGIIYICSNKRGNCMRHIVWLLLLLLLLLLWPMLNEKSTNKNVFAKFLAQTNLFGIYIYTTWLFCVSVTWLYMIIILVGMCIAWIMRIHLECVMTSYVSICIMKHLVCPKPANQPTCIDILYVSHVDQNTRSKQFKAGQTRKLTHTNNTPLPINDARVKRGGGGVYMSQYSATPPTLAL